MKIKRFNGSLSLLRPIIEAWISDCNCEEMGISLDEDVYLKDLQRLIVNDVDSDLLVLEDNRKIVGFMGLETFDSPLGKQRVANEHYWYVMPEHRGISSLRFIRAAEDWARQNRCSHLILNASCLASDLHDKICKIYERKGLRLFESSYIKSI